MRTYYKSLFCLIAFFGFTSFLVAQDAGLDAVIATGAKLEKVAGGFQFTEGPIVDKKGNIYFTDQPNNRIMKWDNKKGISIFLEPAGRANGLFFDKNMNI